MNNVITCHFMGGLGNQLHQYAYGLLIAQKLEAELLLDKEFLEIYSKNLDVTIRDIEINKFENATTLVNARHITIVTERLFATAFPTPTEKGG